MQKNYIKAKKARPTRLSYQQATNEPAYMPTIDYGPQPFSVDIEQATLNNDNYRRTLWTGPNLQLTLMSIQAGDDIGLEVHPSNDQFLRIEQGAGEVQMGTSQNNLTYSQQVYDGFAVFVPAGTWHNIINTGKSPMKIYAIYAPPHHPHGTVHETKEIAELEGD
jgi:mannose-6-phosphate isomerase-like protein (cupin superfamily)